MAGSKRYTGSHGAGDRAEGSTLEPTGSRKRESATGPGFNSETSNPTSNDTFSPKGQYQSNKATCLNPFKYCVTLWVNEGYIFFNPPQLSNSYNIVGQILCFDFCLALFPFRSGLPYDVVVKLWTSRNYFVLCYHRLNNGDYFKSTFLFYNSWQHSVPNECFINNSITIK